MKRDKDTGLLLPDSVHVELDKLRILRHTNRKKKHYYAFYCKHCGYQESYATKEELKLDKKIHKKLGCQMMVAVDRETGARRMIRKQLYLIKKAELRKELNGCS